MTDQKKVKVLCYTDHEDGRDVEMLLPLRYFAENVLGYEWKHGFGYDYHKMFRYQPDVVVLPNTVGSTMYFKLAEYAWEQGIMVFALISEGNFRDDETHDPFGYAVNKRFYQETICLWSQRTLNYFSHTHPELRDKLALTGGTGFDRYSVYEFPSRQEYLKLHKKEQFQKVITYAAWTFGQIYYPTGRIGLTAFFGGDESQLAKVEPQRAEIEQLLRSAIEKYPDVLFILKPHPSERRPTEIEAHTNEIKALDVYDNVIVEDDRTATDGLIAISDLWLSFESTTALEAWLMGKTSILLFTSPDFSPTMTKKRLDKSQAVAHNPQELLAFISEYYETGQIAVFESNAVKQERDWVIESSIGFADGCNHIRAGCILDRDWKKFKPDNPRKRKFRWWYFTMYVLMQLGVFFYNRRIYSMVPKTRKFLWVFEQYRLTHLHRQYAKYSIYLAHFYKKHNIRERHVKGSLSRELFKGEVE